MDFTMDVKRCMHPQENPPSCKNTQKHGEEVELSCFSRQILNGLFFKIPQNLM